jgi:hypothetical protein
MEWKGANEMREAWKNANKMIICNVKTILVSNEI